MRLGKHPSSMLVGDSRQGDTRAGGLPLCPCTCVQVVHASVVLRGGCLTILKHASETSTGATGAKAVNVYSAARRVPPACPLPNSVVRPHRTAPPWPVWRRTNPCPTNSKVVPGGAMVHYQQRSETAKTHHSLPAEVHGKQVHHVHAVDG